MIIIIIKSKFHIRTRIHQSHLRHYFESVQHQVNDDINPFQSTGGPLLKQTFKRWISPAFFPPYRTRLSPAGDLSGDALKDSVSPGRPYSSRLCQYFAFRERREEKREERKEREERRRRKRPVIVVNVAVHFIPPSLEIKRWKGHHIAHLYRAFNRAESIKRSKTMVRRPADKEATERKNTKNGPVSYGLV